ncbi:hypothetical protein GN956_G860 [Arapaima gigas]
MIRLLMVTVARINEGNLPAARRPSRSLTQHGPRQIEACEAGGPPRLAAVRPQERPVALAGFCSRRAPRAKRLDLGPVHLGPGPETGLLKDGPWIAALAWGQVFARPFHPSPSALNKRVLQDSLFIAFLLSFHETLLYICGRITSPFCCAHYCCFISTVRKQSAILTDRGTSKRDSTQRLILRVPAKQLFFQLEVKVSSHQGAGRLARRQPI